MSAQLRSLLNALSAPSRPDRPTWRRLLERSSRTGLALLALSGSLPLVGGLQVLALPTGEQTERGNAVRVDRSDANKLTVQTRGRTVISWKNFNIEAGKSVEFQNDKTVLNYVRLGGGASRLDGTLRATNPIILLNNQGITVGSTALISVPSILLSTGSLLPDSFEKFMQGVDYGGGLNAPLISIQLSNSDGAVAIDGTIKTIKGGGIGLIAPTLTVGPTAVLKSLGSRDSSTGTDGVNVTVNGVEAKGSLWLGTTALSATSYTQPIPGMPGASLPTLPTGFGFTQVGGKPSPQRIQLALQATYDFERVVIGSSGATAGQFDSLFFSPSFRAADFYVYDGIQAIEEGHRQATSGGLRRTLTNAQTHQLISELEADVLGLKLPVGATLLLADDITIDGNGQISGGSLLVDPGPSMGADFVKAFGSGPFSLVFNGGQASVQGTNGKSGTYDIVTGQITWTATVTTPGQPVSTTETGAGSAIDQGTRTPPDGVSGVTGESVSFVSKEAVDGTQGHSWQSCHTGNSGCKGGSPEVRGSATVWKGRFVTDASGHQRFIPDTQAPTDVVYQVDGRYYVVPIGQWTLDPESTLRNPSMAAVTPQVTRTVTTPGTDTTETRTFTDYFKVDREVRTATGAAESTWMQPPTPGPTPFTPPPTPATQTAAPTTPPGNTPDPTVVPPSSGPTTGPVLTAPAPTQPPSTPAPTPAPTAAPNPTKPPQAPTPTQAVPQPTGAVPTLAPTPTAGVVRPLDQPSITGFAPYRVPNPTKPPQAPTPTQAVPQPTGAVPTLAPTPTAGVVRPLDQPSITGFAPYRVPNPTKPPQAPTPTQAVPQPTGAVPTLAPTPTAGVVRPLDQPSITGFAPYRVPNPTKPPQAPTPTQAVPQPTGAVPTLAPTPTAGVVRPLDQPSITGFAPYRVPNPTKPPQAPTPTQAVPQPTGAVPTLAPTPTTGVVRPLDQPSITGFAPYRVPNPTKPPQAPTPTQAVPQPTGAVPTLAPTPTTGVVRPLDQPSITGFAPYRVPNPTKPPQAPLPTQAVPQPTGAVPTLAPTPTTGVVRPLDQPSFTGFAPYRVPNPTKPPQAPTPTQAVPQPTGAVPTLAPTPTAGVVRPTGAVPTLAPDPTAAGVTPAGTGSDRNRPTLLPRSVSPASIQSGTEAERIRRGVSLTYEVPLALINERIRGGDPSRSRATLPDGRALPSEIEYEPNDQTFTIRDTSRLPLPLDVRLTMPTDAGGQGSFVLTIGSP